MGKVCRATEHARLSRVYGPIGSAVELPVQASFAQLELSKFEGGLARTLRFHIFHFHFLREVSHESFAFTSSTFRFCGTSSTKASFSHLPLSFFEGGLARKLRFHILHSLFEEGLAGKLRFHIFHFHFLREVLCVKVAWDRGCVRNSIVFCS